MSKTEKLYTKRLILRPYTPEDVDAVHQIITVSAHEGDDVMPKDKIGEWITNHRKQCDEGKRAVFAITLKENKKLIGSIDLTLDEKDNTRAAMGYWMGEPYRNKGLCTEAAKRLLKYGLDILKLDLIYADHYTWNTASEKVMQKMGMEYEKTYSKFNEQWDMFMDVNRYIVKSGSDTSN